MRMVKIDALNYYYKKSRQEIFRNLSLEFQSGRIYGLLGKNGAGKSTLLYLISGLLFPKSGKVLFNGVDVCKRLPETLSGMFLVPEEFELPKILLSEYIKLYAPFYPNFNEEDMKRCLSVFEIDGDVNLGEISMGQKKKVFMSFAMATNTSLLIMDEPTNGLDIPGKSQFRKFMSSNMSDNRTVIISTHQVNDIGNIIDNVVILDESEILLNVSMCEITEKLYFIESNNQDLTSNAIYSQCSLSGNSLVLENNSGIDSVVNLETLFNATLSKKEVIKGLFNSK